MVLGVDYVDAAFTVDGQRPRVVELTRRPARSAPKAGDIRAIAAENDANCYERDPTYDGIVGDV